MTMVSFLAALQRWGGILIQPRATLTALGQQSDRVGRYDWWLHAGLFVLGSQIEHLPAAIARFQAFRSVLVLVNALALSLLTPLLVGLLVESLVGGARSRYRHLPLVALVVAATVGHLLHQQGVVLPGPRYLAEILGTVWAAGLALWIRKAIPAPEASRA